MLRCLGHAVHGTADCLFGPSCMPPHPGAGQPVLVAFNAAGYAEQLEKKSKQAVKDEYMAVGVLPRLAAAGSAGAELVVGACRRCLSARIVGQRTRAWTPSQSSAYVVRRRLARLVPPARPSQVLRSIFGAGAVPEPVSYDVTAWGADPYSYGSYSFAKAPLAGEGGYRRAHLE